MPFFHPANCRVESRRSEFSVLSVKDFPSACDYISVPEKRANETDRRTQPKRSYSMKQNHPSAALMVTALISAAAVNSHA